MELLQPLGLIALVGLPAIVALYFLRQRRPPKVVGSLMLWQQARAEVFRGRPWDRFRPTVLLWLQLLLMSLLALALARPACVSTGSSAARLVLVLDASASMAATDAAPSRWESAVDKARAAAAAAPEDSEIAVLVAGRLTRVAEPFTRDRDRIDRRLAQLGESSPDATASHISEALLLALQIGGEQGEREIVLISDGAFPQTELPIIGGSARLSFVGVGERGDNLAITTFELRRRAGQRFGTVALCVVTNTGKTPMKGHLRLSAGGRVIEAQGVSLGPGESHTLSTPVSLDEGRVEARLMEIHGEGGAKDHLSLDDEAFAVIAPEKPARILLVDGDPLVERALRANPRLELTSISSESYASHEGERDVTVFEGFFPETIPSGRFLVLGLSGKNPLIEHDEEGLEGPVVASWDRGHPALLHLDLARVRFGAVPKVSNAGSLVPLAEFQGEGGPAVLAGQTPTWRALVFPAPMLETDLPLRVAFPVFLYNAIGWLVPGGAQSRGHTSATGRPLTIPAALSSEVIVTSPSGARHTHTLGEGQSDGVWLFADTSEVGFYEARISSPGGDVVERVYGVSLVDAAESLIEPRGRLQSSRGQVVMASEAVEHVDEKLGAVLWFAFGLLGLEWLIYVWRARKRGA